MVVLLMLMPCGGGIALLRFLFILFLDGIVFVIIAIVTRRPVRTLPVRRGLVVSIDLTTQLMHLALELLRTIVDIRVVDR